MSSKDIFGDRMKKYEAVTDIRLTENLPIIVRLDGNSFSKFTKATKFKKPYDEVMHAAMCEAATAVLKYCSGAMVGYTQSDEITILLRNDQTPKTSAFLDNRAEKMCSLLASKCSVRFSSYLTKVLGRQIEEVFDCRLFILPPSEVNNAFMWRQQDAWKNCVSAVAYHGLKDKYGRKTAQKMLHGVSDNQRQELIFQELQINMNDYPVKYKRGVCIKREKYSSPIEDFLSPEKIKMLGKEGEIVERSSWQVDENIPIFSKDLSYIGELAG